MSQLALFDYSDVPETDRGWLREQTAEIITIVRRSNEDRRRVGRILLDVSNRLPRYFRGWLDANGIAHADAYRCMRIARSLGDREFVSGETENIQPTAFYRLCAPGVPPAGLAKALERAKTEPVTLAVANEIIAEVKPPRAKSPRLFGDDPQPPAPVVNTRAARIERALDELLRTSREIKLEPIDDTEADTLYTGRIYSKDEDVTAPFRHTATTVEDLLEHLAGIMHEKVCTNCGQKKPLSQFTVKSDKADGHDSWCHVCSRKRNAENKKKRDHAA